MFSPETGKPVAHGMDAYAKDCSSSSISINRSLGAEQAPREAFQHTCQPRFSDLDGHGHVNNAVLLSYLQDARHAWRKSCETSVAVRLEDLKSVYVEFLAMASLDDILTTLLWEEPSPSGKSIYLRIMKGFDSAKPRVVLKARMDVAAEDLGKAPKTLRLKPSNAASSATSAGYATFCFSESSVFAW